MIFLEVTRIALVANHLNRIQFFSAESAYSVVVGATETAKVRFWPRAELHSSHQRCQRHLSVQSVDTSIRANNFRCDVPAPGLDTNPNLTFLSIG